MTVYTTQADEDAQAEAYGMGYEDMRPDVAQELAGEAGSEEAAIEAAAESLHHLQESALWANTVAPRLRELAGFEDAGYGTFQQAPSGEAQDRFDSLLDSYTEGYTDRVLEAFETQQADSEGGDA
jgi:hypothetical protein